MSRPGNQNLNFQWSETSPSLHDLEGLGHVWIELHHTEADGFLPHKKPRRLDKEMGDFRILSNRHAYLLFPLGRYTWADVYYWFPSYSAGANRDPQPNGRALGTRY